MTLDQFGSHILPGARYSVLNARGPVFGPAYHRQKLANERQVICYIEGHLNASTTPCASYCSAITAENSGAVTLALAHNILNRVSRAFGINKSSPAVQSGVRGSALVRQVHAPAIVLEPGFVTNPEFQKMLSSGEGLDLMGSCVAGAIIELFPEGGLVALSVGHAYRDGRPMTKGDPGALVPKDQDPDPAFDTEAELVEGYLTSAAEWLCRAR